MSDSDMRGTRLLFWRSMLNDKLVIDHLGAEQRFHVDMLRGARCSVSTAYPQINPWLI
jgi:hypothetical protein